MPRRSSLVAAVLLAAAGLGVAAPRAGAAPESAVREDARVARAVDLARQVGARQQALASLNRRADTRDRALLGRARVLAAYGWSGDPEAARAVLPLADYRISAGFGLTGPLWEDEHGGQDFGAAVGETIVSVAAGTVTEVADAGPYGLRTIVTLPDGTEVWYCHQTSATVQPGQAVDLADVIGTVGSSGNSTGPHLHLEVRPAGGSPVDPMDWLRAAGLTP
ncbi:murein DD-endopeptidase MepM/ murein hydrolase activator NlpD [Nocardioides cavernae]|uniref:Murein DD-endopeptidase MepM/ murein hydrolase activator NlpD n=1 Tax=Nocardioides cavernae TaxID=1921566 RepID=A0A7Y9H5R0_9ACTN|nr:M23 family metallopeptidase [Nocardioides cavernae]NYE38161.1 murein DD-endopeptidase MepM/ murein hydrolase activator NlpD [Nocardioides cavernae]